MTDAATQAQLQQLETAIRQNPDLVARLGRATDRAEVVTLIAAEAKAAGLGLDPAQIATALDAYSLPFPANDELDDADLEKVAAGFPPRVESKMPTHTPDNSVTYGR
ncbi:hypothetical protein [Oleisolibacter albus]|uniref:hypothetical protein n=1 Tax=Oleisolibacter albus TaxID=2171757 RepID=UPI000DF37F10|nr:hypothetical protein [Oleisolibacter albus]